MACYICKRISTNKQMVNGKEYCHLCVGVANKLGGLGKLETNPSEIMASTEIMAPSKDQDQEQRMRELKESAHIILSTSPEISGYSITKHIGIVSKSCVFGLGLWTDFKAILSDNFGGHSKTLESSLDSMINECMLALKVKAVSQGADAVVSIRIDPDEISGGGKSMMMVTATGTMVKLTNNKEE
jgi:uncharacterized protein YbjQ (UPF0145 family)